MSKPQWPEVSKKRPCDICQGNDRCKYAPDGNAATCFRAKSPPIGWKLHKAFASGATFIRERETRLPSVATPPQPPSEQTPAVELEPLPPDELDRIYREFLGRLVLMSGHQTSLKQRGLSDEQINQNLYRSTSAPGVLMRTAEYLYALYSEKLFRVPGFGRKLGGSPSLLTDAFGILIPICNAQKQIIALKLRLDCPTASGKYRYISSSHCGGPSPGSPCHVPFSVEPAAQVRICEGELKAEIATALTGIPTISFPGVNTWHRVLPVLKELGAQTVRVAFDMDAFSNKDVATNLYRCVHGLKQEGYGVEIETWDPVEKGIDDALMAELYIHHATDAESLDVAQRIATRAGLNVERLVLAADAGSASDRPIDEDSLSPQQMDILARLNKVLSTSEPSALFADRKLLTEIADLAPVDRTFFSLCRAKAREAGISTIEFNHATKKLVEEAADRIKPTLNRNATNGYTVDHGAFCRTKNTPDGPVTVPLCNFEAYIVEEIHRDDGSEQDRITFGIEGSLSFELSNGRSLPRVEVCAKEFEKLDWIPANWGSDPVAYPNERGQVAAAIRLHSQSDLNKNKPKRKRTVFEHTGWREFYGVWRYLHAGGSIPAAAKDDSYSVELQPPLHNYCLPKPPAKEEAIKAVTESLKLLTLAPRRIMFPLYAAIFRAVMGHCDFSVSLVGPSGCGKSELASLAMRHYGENFDARNLPGNWSSTANYTERLAFLVKDGLFCIDDYAPSGSPVDVQRYRQAAERIYRNSGNSAGRGRLDQHGATKSPSYPRSLVLSTGEDSAGTLSVRARQLIIEISPDDISLPALTPHQHLAANGVFAQAMAGFIAWLAPRYDHNQAFMKKRVAELRTQATAEQQHSRTPGTVANLAFGAELFFEYALHVGAITPEQQQGLNAECWVALLAIAADQAIHQTTNDPPRQYLRLLASALVTGRVHVADVEVDGPPPKDQTAWGWHKDTVGRANEWRPRGERIGWLDGEFLLLDSKAAFTEMGRYALEQNQAFTVSERTLNKMLNDRGFLACTDSGRETYKVRRTIQRSDKPRSVLCIHIDQLGDVDELATTSGQGETVPSSGPGIDPNEQCRFPEVARVSDHARGPAADAEADAETDCRVNRRDDWQVNSPHPTTTEPTKTDEKWPNVGNVGFSNPRDPNGEIEVFIFPPTD